jgi:glycine amidinotransferase
MINPDTIIMEESETNTIKQVESYGIKVIPCAYHDVYEFGGSFHCTTCDVRRRGEMQSYFPHLDVSL